jgi:hypothetical protein
VRQDDDLSHERLAACVQGLGDYLATLNPTISH